MASIKNEMHSNEINELAEMFRVLGHPGRLSVIFKLSKSTEMGYADMVDIMQLSYSSVYEHVKKLRDVGLITEKAVESKQIFTFNNQYFWEKIKMVRHNSEFENLVAKIDKIWNSFETTLNSEQIDYKPDISQ